MVKKEKKIIKDRRHHSRLDDDYGQPSLGRWMVYYGTVLSIIVTLVGLVICVYEVVFQPMVAGGYHSSVGLPLVACGVGIFTSGAAAKSWQAQAEAKKLAAYSPTEARGPGMNAPTMETGGGPNASRDDDEKPISADPVNN